MKLVLEIIRDNKDFFDNLKDVHEAKVIGFGFGKIDLSNIETTK